MREKRVKKVKVKVKAYYPYETGDKVQFEKAAAVRQWKLPT